MLESVTPVIVVVIVAIIVLAVLGGLARNRYKISAPDEVIIITGRKNKVTRDADGNVLSDVSGQKVVKGGVFVLPFVQQAYKLQLRSRKLNFRSGGAVTKNGITINAEAVATIKIGDTDDTIRAAAQRFLNQQNEIEPFTQDVLSGSLRAIIGTKTVEELLSDREGLAAAVREAAEDALTKQGLLLDNFLIQSIESEDDYITNLGRPQQAAILRQAKIAEAQANRESEEARITAEQAVANAQRELSLRQAAIQAETDRAAAEAAAARPLAEATQQQGIVKQQEITAVANATLRERQLDAEVRKTADADAYRVRQQSEAEAYRVRQAAEADRDRRIAEADALKAVGLAEAEAIRAKGNAEAEATKAKAEALANQADGVLQQMAIEILPQVAREMAAPMGNISNLTVVSSDGASALSKNVASGVLETSTLVKGATGIDLSAMFNSVIGGAAAGAAAGKAARSNAAATSPTVTPSAEHHTEAHETPVVPVVLPGVDTSRVTQSVDANADWAYSKAEEFIRRGVDLSDSSQAEVREWQGIAQDVLNNGSPAAIEKVANIQNLLRK